MSYTKGEWYVGEIFPLPTIYVNQKRVLSISRELPIDEREANAKLISAAPLLFEALTGKEEVPQLYAISWLGTLLRMCNKEKVYESLCKDAEGDFDSVNTMLKELKWLEENGTAAIKKAVGL